MVCVRIVFAKWGREGRWKERDWCEGDGYGHGRERGTPGSRSPLVHRVRSEHAVAAAALGQGGGGGGLGRALPQPHT